VYVPRHFEMVCANELHQLIQASPLGALVTVDSDGLDADHLPFLFDAARGEHGSLLAHVARSNPVWRDSLDGTEVLVIFRAGESYISPNWYPTKHESHRQVPTWNYRVVHAHGRLRVHDDEAFVRGVVARLTREHEARALEPQPWRMSDSEPGYIAELIACIVGIEVEITRLVGKSKLGQDEVARDRLSAGSVLLRRGETALGEAMLRATPTSLPE
jgi:transcriptional regulator